MTKAAALLLAGGLALSACASDEDNGDSGSNGGGDGELKIGVAYDTGGRGDKSFNDSAIAGVEAAVDELGGEIEELSPNDDGSNREELLTQLADAGYNPVIAVGFAYGDIIADVAADYPDTQFAIVDTSVEDLGVDNLTGLVFAEEQGSFLAGVAAASKSVTGHIGFVGGSQSPLIEKFEAGYVAGAQAVKPDIIVDVTYLSPAGDPSGFGDPEGGKVAAQGMYQGGADIVFHAAGGSGEGVFEAAVEAGQRAIGVDSDQYLSASPDQQAVIMTSMLKRVDLAVEDYITAFADDSLEAGTDVLNDLSTEGVGLSDSGGYIDDIQDVIEDFRQQIIDGDIEVPTAP
ncbi:BMP family ABC transporter substrate-binding protein [Blastococcus sp. TML/M2B]|uniref:BMP family lipoprotein n=1 Tax=unclassified Blastococcus TaxID=2619396 RepID=UPI00190B9D62|nr:MULTISPECIES: BMP family ABC transporter substrate-binding protein [unclassified Blastococcus]MBN1093888.1 BMP family ABC transporter substrate-binding protein [Blastococcus sp. TML/M2B]MBN1095993.1 BMP family ABC transporter substrate-binding protein [Blastococcus sp. TML/C7B]